MTRKEEVEKLKPFCVEHNQKSHSGRAQIKDEHGKWKTVTLHRQALINSTGVEPEGMYVLHRCDNHRCINSDHLYWGTQKENMADKIAVGNQHNRSQRHLTEDDIKYIRNNCKPSPRGRPSKNYDTSNSYRGLAKRFNVSMAVIREIYLGQTYNDV